MKTQRYETDQINTASIIRVPAADHNADVPSAVVRQFRSQAHEWAVFIFLYNEGPKIRHQLMRFPTIGERNFDVLVGDDGSTDDCASDKLMNEFSVSARVALPQNLGLSANMKAGLRWLLIETSYRKDSGIGAG